MRALQLAVVHSSIAYADMLDVHRHARKCCCYAELGKTIQCLGSLAWWIKKIVLQVMHVVHEFTNLVLFQQYSAHRAKQESRANSLK